MKSKSSRQKSAPSVSPPLAPAAFPAPRGLNLLLAATTFVSAWLVFQVQPMVAKRILPWFGGGTAVWTTAMLFFQTALFAGYLYAHLLTRALRPARQAAVHIALVLLAASLALGIGVIPTDLWKPQSSAQPVAHILTLLGAFVGLPYLILAATAPLTQLWFARANPGHTPYRLYALSNLGSLAALISYPLFIEPRLGVVRQGAVWSCLYIAFALLVVASAVIALRAARRFPELVPSEFGPTSASKSAPSLVPASADRPLKLQLFFWLALPACASVALLAVTAYLCQDVASIPLLWIAPMVVYLLSFILTFESDRWYRRGFWLPALAVSSFAALYGWRNVSDLALAWELAIQLSLLLVIAMICHGELARMRPSANRLTLFYLSISGGGALGGMLAAIVAPLVLHDYLELQLIVPATWLLAFAVLVTDRQSRFYDGKSFAFLALAAIVFLAFGAGTVSYIVRAGSKAIDQQRSFYGALRVREVNAADPDFAYRQLTNGRISHGAQFRAPAGRRIPSQYYGPQSGVGGLLAPEPATPRRVGVVGLGVGTLAAYALPGDDYRFYDINPQVIDIADRYFTFLADARDRGAKISIIPGDARLQLEQEPPQRFDVLVLDAFTSDSIPSHLLTREAFEVYLRHLADPDGILAIHISNRYLNLSIVVNSVAKRLDLESRMVYSLTDNTPIGSDAVWMLAFRRSAAFAKTKIGMVPDPAVPLPDVLWTDDFNNVVDLLLPQ